MNKRLVLRLSATCRRMDCICNGVPSLSHSSRLSEPRLSEAERQLSEGQWADRSLFVTELLLSTLLADPDHSEDDDLHDYHDAVIRGSDAFSDFGTFGDMGCVEVMTLDVALENLNLREQKEQRPPPL